MIVTLLPWGMNPKLRDNTAIYSLVNDFQYLRKSPENKQHPEENCPQNDV